MPLGKQVADMLSSLRVCIAILLICVGVFVGVEALPIAAVLLLISWTSDSIDGPIARHSHFQSQTWIGDHDLEIDMSATLGLLIYMLAASYVEMWVGILYLLVWMLVFWRYGMLSGLGKAFQAPIYGWFIVIALRHAQPYGIALIGWILIALLITWPKFPESIIPDFLSGFKRIDDPGGRGNVNLEQWGLSVG